MPNKTHTELIRELYESVTTLKERIENLRRDMDRIDKALEENERRRWQLLLAFLGSLLTFVVSLVLLYLRK